MRKPGKEEPNQKSNCPHRNFGSGKTELAELRAPRGRGGKRSHRPRCGEHYFRRRSAGALVEPRGYGLVAPNYVGSNVESFSLPPDIRLRLEWIGTTYIRRGRRPVARRPSAASGSGFLRCRREPRGAGRGERPGPVATADRIVEKAAQCSAAPALRSPALSTTRTSPA